MCSVHFHKHILVIITDQANWLLVNIKAFYPEVNFAWTEMGEHNLKGKAAIDDLYNGFI